MDTTTKAVERLADDIGKGRISRANTAAATLRALAQERDAAVARAERWDTEAAAAKIIIPRLEAERDAARAEVDRYRIALADLVSWQDAWPKMAQRLAQEGQHMQDAVKASRAVLAGKDPDTALAAKENEQ